jgi:nucleoside-diphosphate-sugar epimerase
MAEKVFTTFAKTYDITGLKFVSLRFGNVIGSRGSVIEHFKELAEKGMPLHYTKYAERYFISENDAKSFIFHSLIHLENGSYMMEMGNQVSLQKIAEIVAYFYDIEAHPVPAKPYETLREIDFDFKNPEKFELIETKSLQNNKIFRDILLTSRHRYNDLLDIIAVNKETIYLSHNNEEIKTIITELDNLI